MVLDDGWPFDFPTQDLVEDDPVTAAPERLLAAGHLVDDDAKGPQVRECARIGLVEHLRRHIQRGSHE